MSPDSAMPVLAFLEIDQALSRATRRDLLSAAKVFGDVEAQNVAPILCTGGTRRELDYLTSLLDIWHPIVPEDGSAVFIPRGYFGAPVSSARVGACWEVLEFGRAREWVQATIAEVATRVGIDVRMLSTCDSPVTCHAFGFASTFGRQATKRLYGEVIQAPGASEFAVARLTRALRDSHLRCTRRDRNIYVVSDRGGPTAIAQVRQLYQQHYSRILAVGLVDAQGGAISLPSCELTIRIEATSLQDIAHRTVDVAVEVRRLHAGRALSSSRGRPPVEAAPKPIVLVPANRTD